jgi:hypothetical protein
MCQLMVLGPQGEPLEARYSPDQPRDPDGKFASVGGLDPAKTAADFQRLGGERKLQSVIKKWQMFSGSDKDKTEGEKVQAAIKAGEDNLVVAAIRNESVTGTLHRGLLVSPKDSLLSWKKGDTVQIMPSSFSFSSNVAQNFSRMSPSLGDTSSWKSVVLHAGSDDAHIQGISLSSREQEKSLAGEQEVITGGRFSVVRTKYDAKEKCLNIYLKQTGVF